MGKKILLIDDDEELAFLTREMLEPEGYEVLYAADGLKAIETANSQKIDLILLDIRLPYFSGFWFFNAFRQKPQTKSVPVIVVSAMSREEDVQKAYHMGAAAYLKKPFRQNDLLEVVQKALN